MKKQKKPEPLDRQGLMHAAVDLLSRRDYSRQELYRKLSSRTDDADALQQVLDDLAERRWQSDTRFGAMFVRSRASRGVGPRRLQQELSHKGLSDQDKHEVMSEAETDWQALAIEVAEKKARQIAPDDPQRKAKLWRFLSYRGFSSDQIGYAIDSVLSSTD